MYFGGLKNQIILFKHMFSQMQEKRLTKLDEAEIERLLLVNEQEYQNQSRQPRIV